MAYSGRFVSIYDSHPWRLAKSLMAKQNLSHGANVISNGDPLEIYTTRDGEVIFKKYSLIGGLEDFAAQFCDTLSRSTDFTAAVTDRDAVIAVAGAGKRELLGKPVSDQLEKLMTERSVYHFGGMGAMPPVCQDNANFTAAVAAPVLCEGDVLGAVLFVTDQGRLAGDTECKLAQTVAAFLGKNMENWEKTGPPKRSCFLR